jgi:hypothetical protein
MSDDNPTLSEIGEQNIREREKREERPKGLHFHRLGTPMALIPVDE